MKKEIAHTNDILIQWILDPRLKMFTENKGKKQFKRPLSQSSLL